MTAAQQLDHIGYGRQDIRDLRAMLLAEEYMEYSEAEDESHLVDTIDGLLDIIVIAWGSILQYVGPERAKAAAGEVARANLSKIDGPGLPVFRDDGKVMKPEGFVPPNMADAIGVDE